MGPGTQFRAPSRLRLAVVADAAAVVVQQLQGAVAVKLDLLQFQNLVHEILLSVKGRTRVEPAIGTAWLRGTSTVSTE